MEPKMTPRESVAAARVWEWEDGSARAHEDELAAEEPLEIRVDGRSLSVTMRTPGQDVELAAGFLFTEGLIATQGAIANIAHASSSAMCNVVDVALNDPLAETANSQRNFFAASSCGICGKATIQSIRARGLRPLEGGPAIQPEMLCSLPSRMKDGQQVFDRTGGLHAAALFSVEGELLALREDIGRHNAVDKIVGWALLGGRLPLSNCALMVSGRGGFEIVQKAMVAGIPIVASVSAPSSLAVNFAREMNQTLIGFLRERRFVVYSGESRCFVSNDSLPLAVTS
jgi:FdhD protein